MSKMIAVFALAALAGCTGLQHVPADQRVVSKVFETPGTGKAALHNGAKVWLSETFRSAKAVLEYDNPEDGTLIGNGNVRWPCDGLECVAKGEWRLHATMRIDVKDNRFKLTLSNLRKSWPASSRYAAFDGELVTKDDFEVAAMQLDEFGNGIVKSLSTASTIKNNW